MTSRYSIKVNKQKMLYAKPEVFMLAFLATIALYFVCASADANTKLKKCCAGLLKNNADGKNDPECVERFCDFDAISQTNVLNYLTTCSKKNDTVGHMWDCASSRVDHTDCCKYKGVTGKCLEYCSAHDGVPTNYFDYIFCLEEFNPIRDCFRDYLETH